jgi:6-phosphofructokinase 1
MDRTRAIRLAIKCIEHLEKYADRADLTILGDPMSSTVNGIKGTSVVFTPIKDIEEKETD